MLSLILKRRRAFTGIACSLLLASCAIPRTVQIDPTSYVIRQRNYTYAIYNSEHRLMTHPLTDLRLQMQRRKMRCRERLSAPEANGSLQLSSDGRTTNYTVPPAWATPITDVFVVSHGWNYTGTEAVATYHNFIESIDKFMDKKYPDGSARDAPQDSRDCLRPMEQGYQPFFIFVAWTSTAKPSSDLIGSVLPFDLDNILKPVTYLLDSYPLHMATAWKQSLNAASNALGEGFPDSYLDQDWKKVTFGTEAAYEQESRYGRDIPLSALVFELIKCKYRLQNCHALRDADPPDSGPAPLEGVKIHLVGHSYGAKLVTLAGMEGVRRWLVTDAIPDKLKREVPDGKQLDDASLRERALEELGHQSLPEHPRNILLCSFLWGCPDEERATKTINEVSAAYAQSIQSTFTLPIESLILFNPAMHPGELWYPTSGLQNKAPASLLRLVARKAVLYNKTDVANGTIFNLRELLLNTQVAQFYHNMTGSNGDKEWEDSMSYSLGVAADYLKDAVIAPFAIAYSALYGSAIYLGTTLSNLLLNDLSYHVMHNDSLVDPCEQRNEFQKCLQAKEWYIRWPLRAFNFVDYFAPVIWPPAPFREEDKQGLFRLSRPALGKTGVNRLAAGRDPSINLWGLATFYSDTSNNPSLDYSPIQFCLFSHVSNGDERPDDQPLPYEQTRHQIYSFNTSMVFDTWANSHSDFSKHDEVTCDREQAQGREFGELEKRRFTATFVYRFAKTNFLIHPALQTPH